MAWTTPITWATNQLVAASDMNAQVRDNMNYLLTNRPSVVATASSVSTTSTTFVDMDATNLAPSITVASGKVLLLFQPYTMNTLNGNTNLYLDLMVDGTSVSSGTGIAGSLGATGVGLCIAYLKTSLSVGSHTFKMRYRTGNATYNAYVNGPITVTLLEVG